MRDIKVTQVGLVWVALSSIPASLLIQNLEGPVHYTVTAQGVTPSEFDPGTPLTALEYLVVTGLVWVKAAAPSRLLSGQFESPAERTLFEGMFSTLQQAFLFTNQTALPDLITALASVVENDTTHPVAASVIFEMMTALGVEFSNISTALSNKAPIDNPVFTGDVVAPTRDTADNSTHIATTAYADSAAGIAQSNAEGYADGLLVGLWDDRGTFDPTLGAWPTSADNGSGVDGAILKGDIWSISANGLLTGAVSVNIGDVIRALVDGAGNTAGDWGVTENNLGYTAENNANKATDLTLPDDTKYPTTQAVVTGLGTREPTLPASVLSVKFLREDRTWQSVLEALLTGVSFASGAVVSATDSILVGIGKLQKQITDLAGSFRYVITTPAIVANAYTVTSADVNPYGNKILRLTSAAGINVTLPNPNALSPAAVVGDSFNISQGGIGGITIAGSITGVSTTTSINTTMTLIAESATSWMSVGG